jgi:uncharacterized lipoprotein YmbA
MRYFVLGKAADEGGNRQENFIPECAIAIGRTAVPGHLDRPQLVTQNAGGRIVIHGSYRWGEPLADGIGKVLCHCIERQLPQDLVAVAPWDSGVKPYFRVHPTVDDLAIGDRAVRLRAHCEFWDGKGKTLFGVKRYDSIAARRGVNMEGAVVAVEKLLEEFGNAIGEDLRHMQAGELDLLATGIDGGACATEKKSAAAPVEKISTAEPASTAAPRPRLFYPEIVLEADSLVYVTVDSLQTGERIFSQKIRPKQLRKISHDRPVRVSASDPAGLRINGKSVAEFNAAEL